MPQLAAPEKSTRSLQAIKGGSYTVTLPRWWLKKQSLRKHAQVVMVEDGLTLKLASQELLEQRSKVVIDADSLREPMAFRYAIWTYYMQGADEVTVRSRAVLPASARKQLREVRLDLAGVEVTHEDGHSVVFAFPPGPTGLRLDAMLANMQASASSTLNDSLRSIAEDDLELASGVAGREAEILRIYRGIIRQVVLSSRNPEVAYAGGLGESRDLIIIALLARDLSRSVYHAIYAARHLLRYGKPLGDGGYRKALRNLGDVALAIHRLSLQSFAERDFRKVVEVTRLMGDAKRHEEALSRKVLREAKDVAQAGTLLLIARELRRIAGYGVAIADIAANRMLTPGASL